MARWHLLRLKLRLPSWARSRITSWLVNSWILKGTTSICPPPSPALSLWFTRSTGRLPAFIHKTKCSFVDPTDEHSNHSVKLRSRRTGGCLLPFRRIVSNGNLWHRSTIALHCDTQKHGRSGGRRKEHRLVFECQLVFSPSSMSWYRTHQVSAILDIPLPSEARCPYQLPYRSRCSSACFPS